MVLCKHRNRYREPLDHHKDRTHTSYTVHLNRGLFLQGKIMSDKKNSSVQKYTLSYFHYRFFETPEVGIIGIFVFLQYENELELVTSDINFNSVNPWQIYISIQIHLVGNYFQFISIRSYTKTPITSRVSKKLEWNSSDTESCRLWWIKVHIILLLDHYVFRGNER